MISSWDFADEGPEIFWFSTLKTKQTRMEFICIVSHAQTEWYICDNCNWWHVSPHTKVKGLCSSCLIYYSYTSLCRLLSSTVNELFANFECLWGVVHFSMNPVSMLCAHPLSVAFWEILLHSEGLSPNIQVLFGMQLCWYFPWVQLLLVCFVSQTYVT